MANVAMRNRLSRCFIMDADMSLPGRT